MNEEKDLLFSEEQRFTQLWVWVITCLPLAIITIEQLILKHKPIWLANIIIILIFGTAFPVFMYCLTLRTEVKSDGLYFRFFPFHLSFRKISLIDIEKYEVRTYNPIREYGGWGLRKSYKNGEAYNVSGDRGVQIILKNGKKILFGSQKPEEFVEALAKLMR
jgi:hypothetical protein